MRLIIYEIKKIPASIGLFAAACLLLNFAVMLNGGIDREYVKYISDVTDITGSVINTEFYEKLNQIPPSEYKVRLLSSLESVGEPYADYDAESLGDFYVRGMGFEGRVKALMEDKYKKLQVIIDDINSGESQQHLYAADISHNVHNLLFYEINLLTSLEGMILAVVIMQFLLGYESRYNSGSVVYSSKQGRSLVMYKIAAGFVLGITVYLLINFLSYAFFFRWYDISGFWHSGVLSPFLKAKSGYPLVLWKDFSVRELFWAMSALSLGVVICYAVLGAVVSIAVENQYIHFMLILVISFVFWAVPNMALKISGELYCIVRTFPSGIWYLMKDWFSDGAYAFTFPWFETKSVILWLALGVLGLVFSCRYFYRKDMVR